MKQEGETGQLRKLGSVQGTVAGVGIKYRGGHWLRGTGRIRRKNEKPLCTKVLCFFGQGGTGRVPAEKEAAAAEPEKPAEPGIDPVMQKYMDMVAQQKQKEKEV